MSFLNASLKVTEFVITGFDTTQSPVLVDVIMLVVYVVAVLANIGNILVNVYDKKLHKPMYLLIFNLAVVDILYTTGASPTMISVLVTGVKTISYVPCIIQMFTCHLASLMEMFALSIMAFDRLVAISCPFQYHTYLTKARIVFLTYIKWIVGSDIVAVCPATVISLTHCYTLLRYNYCSYAAVMRTTCVDPNYYFNLIAIINIVINILTRFGVVLTPEERSGLNIGAILGPCLVNPFVYCLRTKEIRHSIIKMFNKVEIS